MIYPVVRELAADGVPVATVCRVLPVSTPGYYSWRLRPPSARAHADAALTTAITAAHHRLLRHLRGGSTRSCGSPVASAPGAKRVERLRRNGGLYGVHRRAAGHLLYLARPEVQVWCPTASEQDARWQQVFGERLARRSRIAKTFVAAALCSADEHRAARLVVRGDHRHHEANPAAAMREAILRSGRQVRAHPATRRRAARPTG